MTGRVVMALVSGSVNCAEDRKLTSGAILVGSSPTLINTYIFCFLGRRMRDKRLYVNAVVRFLYGNAARVTSKAH
ncbi:hypothetical protein BAUCODRAFT_354479 [Baudoinia panamericana UAMH 10762]|uniref:Uncharacterized protein n=1 Tax=Baudoinia panamericana (strain UAMH 10762) TaxID=717646 RepID=M2N734_BAUPA|nr:uncharacterized protein BAUCODRAFT_354479 [Baudoinia panamericana UAMH 10762]EMC99913.1 hypothetical protein BAUCODRAFT_354479 [Baudoinia panamericana UAMH 10762]